LAFGLVLLAGAGQLAGQTVQNPGLVVYGAGANGIQFAHQTGTATPPAQTVRVYSAPANVQYTATAQTNTGGGWLAVNGALTTSGTTGIQGQQDLAISVAATTLPPGTYGGAITVTSGATSVVLGVTLTVADGPQVRLDPASIAAVSIEANRTSTIPLTVGSTGAPVQYVAQVIAAEPNTGWLVPPPANTTGQPTQITINAGQIPPDRTLAIGAIRFTSVTGGGSVTFPVSVNVTPGAQLQVSPTVVNFPYQIGQALPTPRQASVTSTTQTQLPYSATIISASPWLSLATTSTGTGAMTVTGLATPSSFYLIPNVALVPATPGTLEATIRIDSPTSASQNITARLNISNQPQFTLTQDSAIFNYTLGGTALTPATISLGSTSGSQQFTATPVYVGGNNFFTVTPGSGLTPSNLIITVDPTKLATLTAGTYTGSVHVTSTSTTSVLDIPVTLTISGSTLLTVDNFQPDPFEGTQGQTPAAKSIIVRSTDGSSQPFTVGVEYGTGATGWLILSSTAGVTGTASAAITLNVNPQAITAPGSYSANVVITPTSIPNAQPLRVLIRYNVTGSATVTASPTRFDLVQLGSTPLATQTIALTSATTGLSWIASADQTWIKLVNTTGTVPGNVQFTIDPAPLAPREAAYTGNVTISVSGVQTITVPVSVKSQAGATITATPTTITASYAQGSTAPANQTINLTSSGAAVPFSAAAATANGVNWLSVSPASGTTAASGGAPTALTVTINPQGLAPGSYPGTITITPTGTGQAAITINVTLTVTTASAPNGLTIINAATGVARSISPGEIVTIKGRNMAPATGQSFTVTNGQLPVALGGSAVSFDGIPAAILYAGPAGDRNGDQINAIVPYGISGRVSTRLVVTYQNIASDPITLSVAESAPGVFTASQTGSGLAAALNQDNSANSATNPEQRGRIVVIYATGEGLLSPAQGDARVTSTTAPFPMPLLPVSVRINDQPAEVRYAGSAPGLVGGVLQVNAVIPANLNITAPTNVPLVLQVGQNVSQGNVTINVRP